MSAARSYINRHPRSHVLYSYEDVAGTMIHELAHCVRGPHDDKVRPSLWYATGSFYVD